MNIKPLVSFKKNNTEIKIKPQSTPTFKGPSDKLAQKLMTVPDGHLKKMPISFDEAVNLYTKLGCTIFVKQGSHSTVVTPEGKNLALVIPHGKHKTLCAEDIKRLKAEVLKHYKNTDGPKLK